MKIKHVSSLLIAGMVLASLPESHPALESDLDGRRTELTSALQHIEPGITTRAEVEKWLRMRDGGPQGIWGTRYYAEPGMIVEVPYDQTGGTWTDSNRVSGPLQISPGQRHNF